MEENNIDQIRVITAEQEIAPSVINHPAELSTSTLASRTNDAEHIKNAVTVPMPQLMHVTPQYLVDVTNHIAQTDHRKPLLEIETAHSAVEKYKEWQQQRQATEQGYPDYCHFAAFFAFEMVNGSFAAKLPGECLRLALALELISHIILEHTLLDRVWQVEYNLRGALKILRSTGGSAEQLLGTFSIQQRQ